MHTPPAQPALAAATEGCLRELDGIAASYVRQVRTLTGYVESVIDDGELHRTARTTLRLLFDVIRGHGRRSALQVHSEELGRRRARQAVPLESLLRAVRMDFRFIWEAITERATDEASRSTSAWVVLIWEAVESHTTSVQTGYLDEAAQMRAELELETSFLMRRLLSEASGDPSVHRQAAEVLGIAVDDSHRVIVSGEAARTSFSESVRAWAPHTTVLRLDAVEFAVIPAASASRHAEDRLLAMPVGLSPGVRGLTEIAAMWRLACELAQWAHDGRAATVERCWDRLAAARLGTSLRAYRSDVLSRLDDLPQREQQVLLETVDAYLARGSVVVTAESLYCHRNTVVNRLRRFTGLTGLDPTVPRDAGTIRVVAAAAPHEPGAA